MRLHTDILAPSDIYRAVTAAGMTGVHVEATRHGSRARDHAFEVHLTGTSSRRPNGGNYGAGAGYAATWDEWGMFLAALFELDPQAIAGTPGRPTYASGETFHAATWDRFKSLTAPHQHGGSGHKWTRDGYSPWQECDSCEARWDLRFAYRKPDEVAAILAARPSLAKSAR